MKKKREASEIAPRSNRLLSREEKDGISHHRLWHAKKPRTKKYLRVNSQTQLWSDVRKFNELKPMEEIDLKALKEQRFQVKIVDMGNACYENEHFSDVIQTR